MVRPGSALREVFASGYGARDLRADILAGVVVGIVALPLSMALAIASGVPPQHGLYTAIIAGLCIPLIGGARLQVSGPTAAFVAVLAPIATRHGLGGLLIATAMAGVILAAMGLARLGQLVEFVPQPVTAGFTAGIGVVIATLQVKDFFGLQVEHLPAGYLERAWALITALPTTQWAEVLTGAYALTVLLAWPKLTRGTRLHAVPSPLVALASAALLALLATRYVPGFQVDTIAARFTSVAADGTVTHGIPRLPPLPALPWTLPGPNGAPLVLSLDLFRTLALPAVAIAILGAIESLLSAAAADGMKGTRHDPDAELLAQGLGNIVAPFFGGIAATGAIARTATNIRSGARSPVAGAVHAVFVLVAVLALAPALGFLPMAALAALLLVVAWNMAELPHVVRQVRLLPGSDVVVLLLCFSLTVVFDMTVAVTAGVLASTMLFIRRMSETFGINVAGADHPAAWSVLPKGVLVYEISGPLFFGAAQRAVAALQRIGEGAKVVVLDMRLVPAVDATGLHNLDAAIARWHKQGTSVVLAGLQRQPARALVRAGWRGRDGVLVSRGIDRGLALARAAAETAEGPVKTAEPVAP